ncbi:L-seryl-tRNA(Sec) selenium transferase [uncultured Mailhella sp.]|uniref:L-seryl-tRNA(Sec) selenium transferase n=1 Tax=uncultured Mailhella sp. TaxID=1981031 RepID=UPI0025F4E405|nr:L-seryl-tRNA(Sec) selenium transferase [uncultured Mailhella sp.]
MSSLFRSLPSVDACLRWLEEDFAATPHSVLLESCRAVLDELREDIRSGRITDESALSPEQVLPRLQAVVKKKDRPRFCRVINGAGVVVHTNLGRSVLAREAREAVRIAASGYSNLEFDLETGERGSRTSLVEELLCSLTGAEAALVVNNNAAAVLLMLDTLCKGGEVILSRGQLVEIGGSFRIPDVMERSGATLREVGTTNRTHLADYERALTENTRAVLWVHPSNYRIIGFHSSVPADELADFAHAHGLPMLEDLGSGSLMDFSHWGLHDEPTVPEVLRQGTDVVTFSGDKVLGGPQAGIIVGKKAYIDKMKKNQLLRALRCDKLTFAALEATLRLYRDPETARRAIPTVRRMSMDQETLKTRAATLRELLAEELSGLATCSLKEDFSRVGGGSFPEQGMPTTLVCVHPAGCSATQLKMRLLSTDPPLVGRLGDESFELDPRTMDDDEFPDVARVLKDALCGIER